MFLLKFLRGCKFSLEKTKIKLDLSMTFRSTLLIRLIFSPFMNQSIAIFFCEDALPEYFTNWDPMTPENQAALSYGYVGLLICYE